MTRRAAILTPAAGLLAAQRRMRGRGMVLRIDSASKSAVVSHGSFPVNMQPMTMTFRVPRAADFALLSPGVQIRFDLVVDREASHIERIEVVAEATSDFAIETPKDLLTIGARVPDFTLADHRGRRTSLSEFGGSVVAVNFLYTRCPLPDVCPRLAYTFARLQRRFNGRPVGFLSITIDPEYDNPERLAAYAKIWKARDDVWRFLTGGWDEILSIARRFGMTYWAEDGQIAHTTKTAVVARNGTLAAVVEGSRYVVGELGDLIEQELQR